VGFRVIDHKADVKIKISGKTIEELFSEALNGFLHIVVKIKRKAENFERKKISLEGIDLEDLLVRFLNELIYLFSLKKVPLKIENMKIEENRFEGEILLAPLTKELFEVKAELKAATYHNLKIEKKGKNFVTEVVFDV